jgi:DNA-binding CsgD family transcriptional regulator
VVCLPPSLMCSGLTHVLGALNIPFISTPTPRPELVTAGTLVICDADSFAALPTVADVRYVVFSEGASVSCDGVVFLHPTAATSVLLDLASAWRSCDTSANLSVREREILALVSQGMSNEEIACQCFVSTATVKTHLVRCFRKLGVSDRASAVYKAAKMGLI